MPDQEQLQIVITAKDEAGKVLQALSGKVKGTEAATKGLTTATKQSGLSFGQMAGAVAIGTAAVQAAATAYRFLSGFVKQSITDAKAAQVSQEKVNAILKTLTGNYQEHVQTVREAAKAALQLGFDDEDASEGMAKLLQVTGDTTTAQEAMTNAMDLARFKGISLEEATQALTLAMQGSGRVLKQLGIDVPDNASKTEILGLVMQRVAGQAETFGKTAAGAQERYKVALQNVREEIGSFLLPILTKFYDAISTFVTSERFTAFLKRARSFVEDLQSTIQAIAPVLRDQFNETLSITNELLKELGVQSGFGQTSLIDLGLALPIGVLVAFNKTVQLGAGFLLSMKKAAEGLAQSLHLLTDIPANKIADWFGNLNNAIRGLEGLPKRAFGGSVSSSQAYMVGENGPEMFVPDAGGKIVPNSTSNVTINVGSVRNDADLQSIIDTVTSVLGRRQDLASKGAY